MGPDLLLAVVPLVIGVVFAVFGVGLVRSGLAGRSEERALQAHGVETLAEVTAVRTRRSGSRRNRQVRYHPVFAFHLPDGRHVQAESRFGTRPAPAEVGQQVRVRYLPSAPQQASMAEGMARPGHSGTAMVVIGGVLLLVSLLPLGLGLLLGGMVLA